MKSIVDAQLPRRLVHVLRGFGWDVVHTLDLPLGNRTPDSQIADIADTEERFVITKDADFVHSHLLRGKPRRLILVATGNVSNSALVSLFTIHIRSIEAYASEGDHVSISPLGVEPGQPPF